MTTSADDARTPHVRDGLLRPSSVGKRSERALFKMVPPRCTMSATERDVNSMNSPWIRPWNPRSTPTTSDARGQRGAHDRTDRGVHPRRIAAAGQDADTPHFTAKLVHPLVADLAPPASPRMRPSSHRSAASLLETPPASRRRPRLAVPFDAVFDQLVGLNASSSARWRRIASLMFAATLGVAMAPPRGSGITSSTTPSRGGRWR